MVAPEVLLSGNWTCLSGFFSSELNNLFKQETKCLQASSFTVSSADFMQGCVFVNVCVSVMMMPLISLNQTSGMNCLCCSKVFLACTSAAIKSLSLK